VFFIEVFNYTELDVIYSGDRVQDLRPVIQQTIQGFITKAAKHYTAILY
jgi:hypothetical protein